MSVTFKGATAYEAQAGRLWVRVLRPRFINHRTRRSIVVVGIETR